MRLLIFFLLLTPLFGFPQISLNDLQKAGINSESDVKSLGVSQSDIDALKEEIVKEKVNTVITENPSAAQPNNEKNEEVVVVSKKDNSVKEKVFGQSIFRSGAIKIQSNSDRIDPDPNYKLGPGDKISVTIWGLSQFSGEFTLDDLGNVTPNLVGRINLKGKTYKQVQNIILKRFGQVYRFNSSEISVTLSYSKLISVNIVGEVVSPGTFSIPSINSAFNILTLSNGLSPNGSVRNIAVVRNGLVVGTLDVYKFLKNPDESSQLYLSDGDFILVPVIENIIGVSGEIRNPGSYELKSDETLKDLITFSGGFKANASTNSISVFSRTDSGIVVRSFNMEEAESVQLNNGDSVVVGEKSSVIGNRISIKGEVNSPGNYEFKKGESLYDLLQRVNGLTSESYSKSIHIYRVTDDLQKKISSISLYDLAALKSFSLKDLDEIVVYNKKDFIDSNYVYLNGVVRKPGRFLFKKGMRLSDIMTMAGGAYPYAELNRIEVERIEFKNSKSDTINYVKLITISLNESENFELEPFDIINVRTLPKFKFQQTIEVVGEVKYPGVYSLSNSALRISDVIERAGGVTDEAYLSKAYINRKENGLGIILLNLVTVLKKPNTRFNYVLKPNDKIVIPAENDVVSISGAIGSKFINRPDAINTPYHFNKRANFYIKKYAGGYDNRANKRKVYAITMNGQVKKSKIFGLLKPKIEKGDEIIVNYKDEKPKRNEKNKFNWNNAFENLTVKLTAVATLWVLINTVPN